MNSVPACAGLYNQTFSPENGEGVFLCLKSETKYLAHSSQPSVCCLRIQRLKARSA